MLHSTQAKRRIAYLGVVIYHGTKYAILLAGTPQSAPLAEANEIVRIGNDW